MSRCTALDTATSPPPPRPRRPRPRRPARCLRSYFSSAAICTYELRASACRRLRRVPRSYFTLRNRGQRATCARQTVPITTSMETHTVCKVRQMCLLGSKNFYGLPLATEQTAKYTLGLSGRNPLSTQLFKRENETVKITKYGSNKYVALKRVISSARFESALGRISLSNKLQDHLPFWRIELKNRAFFGIESHFCFILHFVSTLTELLHMCLAGRMKVVVSVNALFICNARNNVLGRCYTTREIKNKMAVITSLQSLVRRKLLHSSG